MAGIEWEHRREVTDGVRDARIEYSLVRLTYPSEMGAAKRIWAEANIISHIKATPHPPPGCCVKTNL